MKVKGKPWLSINVNVGEDLICFEGRQYKSDRKMYEGEDCFMDLTKKQARELGDLLLAFSSGYLDTK